MSVFSRQTRKMAAKRKAGMGNLDPYRPSSLGIPASMPGFGRLPAGVQPATHTNLSGFELDWTAIGNSFLDLLPTVANTASSAIASSYQSAALKAEAEKIRAEAEANSALAQIQQAANSPTTWGILAGAAAIGFLGYIMLNKKSREKRTVRRKLKEG